MSYLFGLKKQDKHKKITGSNDHITLKKRAKTFREEKREKIEKEGEAVQRTKMLRSRALCAIGTLALLFISSVCADDVVVLTESNFEKEVGQDRGSLVEFYAPWYI